MRLITVTFLLFLFVGSLGFGGQRDRDELQPRLKALELQNKELEERARTLEQRLSSLERLNGSDITLGEGGSSIRISRAGVTIESNEITLKSSGQIRVLSTGKLTLKGASITSN